MKLCAIFLPLAGLVAGLETMVLVARAEVPADASGSVLFSPAAARSALQRTSRSPLFLRSDPSVPATKGGSFLIIELPAMQEPALDPPVKVVVPPGHETLEPSDPVKRLRHHRERGAGIS